MPDTKIKRYQDELIRWNRKFAFTSVPDDQIFNKLIRPSAWLGEVFAQHKIGLIVDFGSGAGIPAIPMAIMDSTNSYFLLESSRKKCGFLRHVINLLDLNNVTVREGRVTPDNSPDSIDMITSRAAGDIESVMRLLSSSLNPPRSDLSYSGCFFKGSDAEEEISDLYTNFPGFAANCLDVPRWFNDLQLISITSPSG